jgi:hypothetical protein
MRRQIVLDESEVIDNLGLSDVLSAFRIARDTANREGFAMVAGRFQEAIDKFEQANQDFADQEGPAKDKKYGLCAVVF